MSSEEDFTDEELDSDPEIPAKTISSVAVNLSRGAIDSIEKRSTGTTSGQSGNEYFPDSYSNEKRVIATASNFTSSTIPSATPSTSGINLPGKNTGNAAYMRFLAERKDDAFSSDDFSSDEQHSEKNWDGFEDANDNSKVKRDLKALQAYLSQDDSSCDESGPVESVIGAIPHLSLPAVISGVDEPHSQEQLITESLKQNKACVERLEKAREAMEKRLADIRARFTIITTEISSAIKVKKSDGWLLNLCYSTPYFRDQVGFSPPYNVDYERKLRRKEVLGLEWLRENPWLVRDSQFICDEVREWEIEGILLQRERERNAIRRKIAKCEDKDEMAALEEQLDAVEDTSTDHLSLEDVVGSRKEGHPDWLAMSVNKRGVDRSPEAMQAVWENFLDPRLPKGGWNDDEDYRLREVAREHNEQNWEAIAAKLGTGRTGFMCFMRYKGAVDRDFLHMRFDAQEDGFVRRSVAATMYNQNISWNQAEFLYRGRRDKRSLMRRWYRLEADANEDIKKGKFTKEEDFAIMCSVRELGTSDFSAIARHAFGIARSGVQVQKRYETLTSDNVRGQWSLEEDILLVRLVNQFGRTWRKVRAEFGEHRSEQQLRFRYESVSKYIAERLTTTDKTLEQVLTEMASTAILQTRLQSRRLKHLRYKARLCDMDEDDLRERQKKLVRQRRLNYTHKKQSAEIDEQFLKIFAVSYTPPEIAEGLCNPPDPRELADVLSLLLEVFKFNVLLPSDDNYHSFEDDPVLGPAIAVLRLDQIDKSPVNNSPFGHTLSILAGSGQNTNSKDPECCEIVGSTLPTSIELKQGSDYTIQILGPLVSVSNVKREVDYESLIPVAPSNIDAMKNKSAGPMVSIPNLSVMKNSAQCVKPLPATEVISEGDAVASSRCLRSLSRRSSSAALSVQIEKHYLGSRAPDDDGQTVKNNQAPGPSDKVTKPNKSPAVTCVKNVQKKTNPNATGIKTIQNKSQVAVTKDKTAPKQPVRAYAKAKKVCTASKRPVAAEHPIGKKPAEPVVCIDLELPPVTVAVEANSVSLSSLLPLVPDVTPLKSRAAAAARADKIEVVSNGKKIVLTKVTALPPGVKLVKEGGAKTAAGVALEATPIDQTATTISPAQAGSSKRPASSPTQSLQHKRLKTAGEVERQVDLWTGNPLILPETFNFPGEKRYCMYGKPRPRTEVVPGSKRLALPPGLISMIGLRTLLASVNASATRKVNENEPEKQPPDDANNEENSHALELWESRTLALLSFPALLARNALFRVAPEVKPNSITDMERQFPPIGISQPPPGLRKYTRKRPQAK